MPTAIPVKYDVVDSFGKLMELVAPLEESHR